MPEGREATALDEAHGHPGEACQWRAADDGGPSVACTAGREASPDDGIDWTIRPEDTCQECLSESDDDLGAYLAAVVRNHPHVSAPARKSPCPSGDTDCTVDCGRCKGGTRGALG